MKTVLYSILISVLISYTIASIGESTSLSKEERLESIKKTLNDIQEYKSHLTNNKKSNIYQINRLVNDYRPSLVIMCVIGITLFIIMASIIQKTKKEMSIKRLNKYFEVRRLPNEIKEFKNSFNNNDLFTFGEVENSLDESNFITKEDNSLNLSCDDRNDLETIIDFLY